MEFAKVLQVPFYLSAGSVGLYQIPGISSAGGTYIVAGGHGKSWKIMEDSHFVLPESGRLLPCICACFDKRTQYRVDFTTKLQKNTCNIRTIAIIYSKDRFVYCKEKMPSMEGAALC